MRSGGRHRPAVRVMWAVGVPLVVGFVRRTIISQARGDHTSWQSQNGLACGGMSDSVDEIEMGRSPRPRLVDDNITKARHGWRVASGTDVCMLVPGTMGFNIRDDMH